MKEIIRVKCGKCVYDFEEVYVVVDRFDDGALYYTLRGICVLQCLDILDSVPIMYDSHCDRLMDIAEYLRDMRSEARPDLAPIDCSLESDIDSLVRDHMAKKSQPDLEES